MFKNIDLVHYVVQHPVKVHPDANLFEAVNLLTTHRVSGLCVVDEDNRLLGVLSEIDCLRGMLSSTYHDSRVGTVSECMTPLRNVQTVKMTDSIVDIASDMLAKKIRRRPVLDDDGVLIGQITIRQILRALKKFAQVQDQGDSA